MLEIIQSEIDKIRPISNKWYEICKKHWDGLTKPLNSMGTFEEIVCQIGAIRHMEDISLYNKACVVMCADNGIVEEGVTQCDNSITALVTEHLAQGIGNVNIMGRISDVNVIPVDIGIANPVYHPDIRKMRVMNGTRNFTKGPAMTEDECAHAMLAGIDLVNELKQSGYDIIAIGEMGIGNTTTSSALASVFLSMDPEEVTGPGAGLSSEGIQRKIKTIKKGIAVNKPDPNDAFDVLRKLGGLDIAGLVGVIIGCAVSGLPVILDGFISYAAAMTAVRMAPETRDYMIASHISGEPASRKIVEKLGLKPVINASMALGEGTGAVALFPLLEMALAVYNMNQTFEDSGMDAYEYFK